MSLSLLETDQNSPITSRQMSQEVPAQCATTLQGRNSSYQATGMSIDKFSINDSGYGPSRQSFAATGVNIDRAGEAISPLTRSLPLPPECGSNLRWYPDKVSDELIDQRFAEVLLVIETLLKSIPNQRCLTIRLMFLGEDVAAVTPYTVIFCSEKESKRVQYKAGKPRVKTLCESEDLILGILVIPHETRLTIGPSNIEICRNETTTLCGAPILLVNKSNDAYVNESRKTTFGGMIKITTADGKSKLYGMTAGHVLDDWRNVLADTANIFGASTDETCSFQDLIDCEPSPSRQTESRRTEVEYQNILRRAWDFANADAFTKIDDCGTKRSSNNNAQQSHDWVLFTAKSSMSNELCALKSPGCFERRELKKAARPTFYGGISETAIVIDGSHAPDRGELSSIMSRILIGSSGAFIDAYILTPNEKDIDCDGNSGSLVVHNGSPLVFGYVVATDLFGDAYVIPMADTVDDIKRCMGAKTVELPTAKDFEAIENSTAELTTETPTKETSRGGTVMPQQHKSERSILQTPPYSHCAESDYAGRGNNFDDFGLDKPSPKPTFVRNIWPALFSSPRICHDRPWRDIVIDLEDAVDEFEDVFDDSEDVDEFRSLLCGLDLDPDPLEMEILQDYCRETSPRDVKTSKGPAGFHRVVWLDDRTNGLDMKGRGETRLYENPLTATGLHRALSNQRFYPNQLPEATRRLIYISDLDPACIYALLETSSHHQHQSLRNAIYKYLKCQASIKVKILSNGYLTYQLDLHVPFFVLSKRLPPHVLNGTIKTNPPRRWIDLSFLNFDGFEPRTKNSTEVWGMQEAQVSCVITGTDDWQWVGYGFVDSEVDGLLTDSSGDDMRFDPISCQKLVVEPPIWQPRDYWLRIFEIRIASIGKQWHYILYKLQCVIDAHITEEFKPPFLSKKVAQQVGEVREALEWALQTVETLRYLIDTLSNTLDAWARFSSYNGDIRYFDNDEHSGRSLRAIKGVFGELKGVYKAFVGLSERCSDYMRTHELFLSLESNKAANQNGVTWELTVSIFYFIALASGVFSTETEAIPFEMTPRSFIITIFVLVFTVYALKLSGQILVPRLRLILMMLVRELKVQLRRLKSHMSKREDDLESQKEKRGSPGGEN